MHEASNLFFLRRQATHATLICPRFGCACGDCSRECAGLGLDAGSSSVRSSFADLLGRSCLSADAILLEADKFRRSAIIVEA